MTAIHRQQSSVYLEPELVPLLEEWAQRHSKKLGGLRVTRADAIRLLLRRGLAEDGIK